MNTTLGQLLVNEALPEQYRDYTRLVDKKELKRVMGNIATRNPELYKETAHRLMRVGQSSAATSDYSFGLNDFTPSGLKKKVVKDIIGKIDNLLSSPDKSDTDVEAELVRLLASKIDILTKQNLTEEAARGNRLAEVIAAGSKGSPGQFSTTVATPLLFSDSGGKPVPIPILNSVAEGLDPAEYWGSTYGTRLGVISTKFATQDAGAFAKELARSANRLVVTEDDCGTETGFLTDGSDAENLGTVLQRDVDGIRRGTILTKDHLKKLRGKQILVRSPISCQAKDGLCAKCSGVRERGRLPDIGDNIGITSSSALSERLSQGSLNVKHGGGAVSGRKQYTFADVDRLFQMPEAYPGVAAIAQTDGTVTAIKPAPGGGNYVYLNGKDEHWVDPKTPIIAKVGMKVHAGDKLAQGVVNPKELAPLVGIGEARRQFIESLQEVTGNAVSRRNAEVIARAAVSHVQTDTLYGPAGTVMTDVQRYEDAVKDYMPREGASLADLKAAKGKYLEAPVLHYTIGTPVSDRVIKDLQSTGLKNILVHAEPPPFHPAPQRLKAHSKYDSDLFARLGGTNLSAVFIDAATTGAKSVVGPSTSPYPSLARGVDFGKTTQETGKY